MQQNRRHGRANIVAEMESLLKIKTSFRNVMTNATSRFVIDGRGGSEWIHADEKFRLRKEKGGLSRSPPCVLSGYAGKIFRCVDLNKFTAPSTKRSPTPCPPTSERSGSPTPSSCSPC